MFECVFILHMCDVLPCWHNKQWWWW